MSKLLSRWSCALASTFFLLASIIVWPPSHAAAGQGQKFSPAATATSPAAPVITQQPISTNAAVGSSVTLCVVATGSPAPEYQWRRNGVNINGQTNSCLVIPNAHPSSGGNYAVVVANPEGIVTSQPAIVTAETLSPTPSDNFSDRTTITGSMGEFTGQNSFATAEPRERNHAGKPGGKSVWYVWVAPATGIATFDTKGSSFDTLLAIYRGTSVSNLIVQAEDEDSGGFLNSLVRFNVMADVEYQIAIDGFAGDSGKFALNWSFEPSADPLPRILVSPQSRTVGQGSNVTFTIVASGTALTYRWLLNGVIIPGANEFSLSIPDVQSANLGEYVARLESGARVVDSAPASLQMNLTGSAVQPVLARDKFQDAINAPNPLRLGTPGGSSSGTHTLNTFGSQTQVGEPNHCDVAGGASRWITLQTEKPGQLYLDTAGSSFDTVVAIYTGSTVASWQALACDNRGGLDGISSSTHAPVSPGITYLIVVDGVKAATGLLNLHYALVPSASLSFVGFNPTRQPLLRLTGEAGTSFVLQGSEDLSVWTNLLTNTPPTGVFDFTDQTAGAASHRFYRAQILP